VLLDLGTEAVGLLAPSPGVPVQAERPGEARAAVEGDPRVSLRVDEVAGWSRTSQIPLSGSAQWSATKSTSRRKWGQASRRVWSSITSQIVMQSSSSP
jgi:hypothetical protein